MNSRDTVKMVVDEYPSTDESDIDAFLEYAREKVAANNISYDTTSFQDFERLLQNCIADHFLDSNTAGGGDADSMTSEVSFSGYVNEGCDNGGSRHNKSGLSTKRDIMSDNVYHRMKGIIARKKQASSKHRIIQPVESQDTDTSTLSGTESGVHFMTTLSTSKLLDGNDERNVSIESDSSDSILDNMYPQQTRQRKHRRRPRSKRQLRGESINSDPNVAVDQNGLALQRASVSKEEVVQQDRRIDGTFHLGTYETDTTGRSSSSTTSNPLIDTTNSILPSLVKKGIKYYDIPKIENILTRMSRKTHTMNRKQKVLDQLVKTRPIQINTSNSKQRGMALVHKLRAERKMALQAAFLRYSGQKEDVLQEHTRLDIPDVLEDESFVTWKPDYCQREVIVPASKQHNLAQSPSSLSSFSSMEERNRFKTFVDKTKRTLSFHHHDKEGLLQKHVRDEFWMNTSYSSPDEAAFVQKTSSPFGKIKFSRLKATAHYAELSTSSLSNDSWNDSGDYSAQRSSDSNHQDENPMQSSDFSEWSEMSFTSDPNRFTGFCTSYKNKTKSCQATRLPTIQCNEPKAFDDSFDELVLRSKTNSSGNNFLNREGDVSPTGVMDFAFDFPQHKQAKDTDDALAFVDEDEGNHVFTDNKEDSFVMKSPGRKLSTSPLYQPVFLSPSRFEI